mmetsp:Transcript_36950/g.83194  ORF Transcript_36950/g.83194 Transcript_36950/m.83194 type:complete len:394 (-) Transcript_36950:1872-3053(-)
MATLESLPTISEEDGDSDRSAKSSEALDRQINANQQVSSSNSPHPPQTKDVKKKDKKAKKKAKKDAAFTTEENDTAHQILVDLCTEMKELKTTMIDSNEKTAAAMAGNLESNNNVVKNLSSQMEMLRSNMKELDQVIESRATPAQIEELARLRSVQEMIKAVTDDKERTVSVYEDHARRGYEEIERLRQDLDNERKETLALRSEIEILRSGRQQMGNVFITTGDSSVGGDSMDNSRAKSGSLYINGGPPLTGSNARTASLTNSALFDDMTLETRGSYDTTTYEMKSMKKRIVHMKKKLAVAQNEAKDAANLRSEIEKMRVKYETERKASAAKDERIKRLETDIEELKRNQAGMLSARQGTSLGTSQARTYTKTVTHTKPLSSTKKKKNWWNNL